MFSNVNSFAVDLETILRINACVRRRAIPASRTGMQARAQVRCQLWASDHLYLCSYRGRADVPLGHSRARSQYVEVYGHDHTRRRKHSRARRTRGAPRTQRLLGSQAVIEGCGVRGACQILR